MMKKKKLKYYTLCRPQHKSFLISLTAPFLIAWFPCNNAGVKDIQGIFALIRFQFKKFSLLKFKECRYLPKMYESDVF